MKKFQQRQRDVHRRFARIRKFGPQRLLVWLHGWFLFGERKLQPHIRIHVAVRKVMRHLTHGPSAWTIRRVELPAGKSADRFAQTFRRVFNLLDRRGTLGRNKNALRHVASNRVAQIARGHRLISVRTTSTFSITLRMARVARPFQLGQPWERQSPDWRVANRQSGDWRSQEKYNSARRVYRNLDAHRFPHLSRG